MQDPEKFLRIYISYLLNNYQHNYRLCDLYNNCISTNKSFLSCISFFYYSSLTPFFFKIQLFFINQISFCYFAIVVIIYIFTKWILPNFPLTASARLVALNPHKKLNSPPRPLTGIAGQGCAPPSLLRVKALLLMLLPPWYYFVEPLQFFSLHILILYPLILILHLLFL